AKWRFLPKTAVLLDGLYNGRSYFSSASASPRANLMKVMAGLAGLLTTRLSVVAKAGWGKDFGPGDGAACLAHAEGTYFLSETANMRGGYVRTLDPIPLYGSMRNDRVFLEARALFGGIFTLRLYAAYDWLFFFNNSNRLDQAISVDVGPQVAVTPWFLIAA